MLASLFVVFAAVAGVMFLLHQSPRAASGPTTTSTPAVSSSDTVRMQTATRAAAAATTAARSKLDAMTGFPTTHKVSAVLNPYVASLRRYETVLRGTDLPTAARTAARSALVLVTRDVQFLGTIDGLPPVRLGSYLEDFGTNATQLLKTLNTLERALHTPTT
ncbi:MAG TPA: hypothetical protein VHX67_07875 [Acidimicrobiales bacterium]|nr:hypothetical protein [Acidimicrobiales bacterium]